MKIRKKENIISMIYKGLILNTLNKSKTNTYSCEYINNMPTILSGTAEPTSDIGKNGDIYIKIES